MIQVLLLLLLLLSSQGTNTNTITIDFMNYFKWSPVKIRDLWAQKDIGVVNNRYAHDYCNN